MQYMTDKDTKRIMDLRRWQRVLRDKRRVIAHNMARQAAINDRSDATVYNRVFSRLLNAIETPADYGNKNWVA